MKRVCESGSFWLLPAAAGLTGFPQATAHLTAMLLQYIHGSELNQTSNSLVESVKSLKGLFECIPAN